MSKVWFVEFGFRDLRKNETIPENWFSKQVYDGVITSKLLDQFTALTKKTFLSYMNESISDRLRTALKTEETKEMKEQPVGEEDSHQANMDSKIVTTEEEIESFLLLNLY